jgi:putative peptidoglycan lipid II flippase
MMVMLNVPATFGLVVLATPIVRLLFERGHFLPADTAATAAAVQLYAVGLVGYSAVRIVSPTFYAIGESRVPAIVSACVIAGNVVGSVAFVRMIGFEGLALGTSIAAIVNAAALLWMLRGRLGGLEGRRLSLTFVRVTLAASVMAVAAVAIQHAMERVLPGSRTIPQIVRLAASIGGSLAVLAGAARILRLEEFDGAVAMTLGRVRKLLGH